MKHWRLKERGSSNLACLLQGHEFCNDKCNQCTPHIGHCICGAIVVWSEDRNLPDLGDYYGGVGDRLNIYESK